MVGVLKKKMNRADSLKEASRKRRKEAKEDLSRAILEAASALFLEHGYESFSLRQVAEHIGYSPGTIYLYFQDKDEILFTIMNEGVQQFSVVFGEAAATPEPKERLIKVARAFVEFGIQNPAYYQLMFMQRTDYFLRYRDSDSQPLIELTAAWQAVIEDAMQAGALHKGDAAATADALWGLLHGVVSLAILMPNFDKQRIVAMVQTAIGILETGLH